MTSVQSIVDGFSDGFVKESSVESMNRAPIPTVKSQTNWRFAMYSDRIELSDGLHVFSFGLSSGKLTQSLSSVVSRFEDGDIGKFGRGARSTGTAQIHRAGFDEVYLTVHGALNRTFTLRKVTNSKWRVVFKDDGMTNMKLDKQALFEGFKYAGYKDLRHTGNAVVDKVVHDSSNASDFIKNQDYGLDDPDPFTRKRFKNVYDLGVGGIHAAGMGMNRPPAAALVGMLLGGAYDMGKRKLYNTDRENEQETTMDRVKRYAVPALALGGGAALGKYLFPEGGDNLQGINYSERY